jgi:hypothetical protein
MKLGFICLNVPGHLNPMTTLARHLQYRNHEVVFLYSSGAAGDKISNRRFCVISPTVAPAALLASSARGTRR